MKRHHQADPSFALVYFYFDFNVHKKQQSSSLLRSLLTQLVSDFPECLDALVELHSQCQKGVQQPTPDSLFHALKSMIECLQGVYVVVDALDECSDPTDLLALMTEITSWKLDNLHILATSRRERYIEDSLGQLVSAQIGLDSSVVDEDIRTYLSAKLGMDPRFKKWTAEEHLEIEDTLIGGADGM